MNDYKNRDWLYQQYIEEEKSAPMIGEMCRVSHVTILYWLRNFDISVRTTTEAFKLKGTKQKKSESLKKHYKKHGAVWTDRKHKEETKKKMSESRRKYLEENEHNWTGKIHIEETKKRMSEHMLKYLEENKHPCVGLKKEHSEETRMKISATLQGIDVKDWNGFKRFEPYCEKFNEEKKEEIRNRDARICRLCGKSEIENKQRLTVHHIDGDKTQGCESKWYLAAVCRSCNGIKETPEKEFLIVVNRF